MEKEFNRYELTKYVTAGSLVTSTVLIIAGLFSGWVGFLFIFLILNVIYVTLIWLLLKEE
jgi:hypothetical protein